MSTDFLSCDWGTTSFRLRWVRGTDRSVVRELREPAGIKSLYQESTSAGADRASVLAGFLRGQLEGLARRAPLPEGIPLVISGMASSSIGWREVPYANVPFPLDGRGLLAEEIAWDKPAWLGTTHLLSGMASSEEMMRGEESEIIGLMNAPGMSAWRRRSLLILPGTHCKHVWIDQEQVVAFRTFMTGELFEVLARQSILRASVDLESCAGTRQLSGADRAAFAEGAACARERGLAGALFRVRTRAVLGRQPLRENTWFLSGLLIGAELEHLERNAEDRPVLLAATSAFAEVYSLALQTAGSRVKLIVLPAEEVERSTVTTHALFLQNRMASPA